MATHSSILAWRIPGIEEPGGLPSMGSHRVGHDWRDLAAAAASWPPPPSHPPTYPSPCHTHKQNHEQDKSSSLLWMLQYLSNWQAPLHSSFWIHPDKNCKQKHPNIEHSPLFLFFLGQEHVLFRQQIPNTPCDFFIAFLKTCRYRCTFLELSTSLL